MTRVTKRQVQGQALAELQLVQGHIADMALDIDAAALLIYRASWTKDSGAPRITREAAMAKLFATERAQVIIDKAVQLHGGMGVSNEMSIGHYLKRFTVIDSMFGNAQHHINKYTTL